MVWQRVNQITDMALHLNDGSTSVALEHRFRPIKKEAINMKAGTTTILLELFPFVNFLLSSPHPRPHSSNF
jgi:hypothetical protein